MGVPVRAYLRLQPRTYTRASRARARIGSRCVNTETGGNGGGTRRLSKRRSASSSVKSRSSARDGPPLRSLSKETPRRIRIGVEEANRETQLARSNISCCDENRTRSSVVAFRILRRPGTILPDISFQPDPPRRIFLSISGDNE